MFKFSTTLLVGVGLTAVAATSFAQTDLSPLFAPPTPAEIEAVSADWSARDTTPSNWAVEDEGAVDGFAVRVVSYELEGSIRYGALRLPRFGPPDGPWPVVMLHHGGTTGFDLDFLLEFDADHVGACLADSFLVVAPTYRDETFSGQGVVSTRTSGGDPSPFDRDADDAMALLTAVLAEVPEADASRIVQWGRSRGANVAWHTALRDERVRRTSAYFAPSDFRLPEVEADCQAAVDTGIPSTDSLAKRVMSFIAEPWIAGDLTLDQARHLLTAWSVTPHLGAPVAVQIHHGDSDTRVPVQHALVAAAALTAAGATAPEFVATIYPGGGHGLTGLTGHADLTEPYLCLPVIPTAAAATRIPPTIALRAYPNPFRGRTEIVAVQGDDMSISITICDIIDVSGRRVASVTVLPEGTGWTGRDVRGRRLPAGVYLVRPRGWTGRALSLTMMD